MLIIWQSLGEEGKHIPQGIVSPIDFLPTKTFFEVRHV